MGMRVAITGGIGSGKSYFCKSLQRHGIEVFDCDASAKRLMRTLPSLKADLKRLIGKEVYVSGVLQKQILAQFLLVNDKNKIAVNNLIHPAVAIDFEQSGLQWLESAIFFDSGFDRRVRVDKVVCVTAPLEIRIQRVMQRDGLTREKTLEWIDRQLPQEDILQRSNYEIVNDGKRNIDEQTNELLTKLIEL